MLKSLSFEYRKTFVNNPKCTACNAGVVKLKITCQTLLEYKHQNQAKVNRETIKPIEANGWWSGEGKTNYHLALSEIMCPSCLSITCKMSQLWINEDSIGVSHVCFAIFCEIILAH